MADERLTLYRKVLRLRTSLKTVSQISWNLSQLERNFSMNNASEELLQQLHDAYVEHYLMLRDTLAHLEKDIKEGTCQQNK